MSDYQAKIDAKRARYAELAEKAAREARALSASSRRIAQGCAEPIKVGHHSEARHRRDIDKSRSQMGRSVEAFEKAEYYARKAESYGSHGISKHDPDAIKKLEDELAKLTKRHDWLKAAKKSGDERVESYMLTNSSANIRRVKQRIEKLKKAVAQ